MINNQCSESCFIEAGVPQGSILGPLFFLVYINDLVNDIKSNVHLFADDTSLYLVVDSPTNAAVLLNDDLKVIVNWAKTWLVLFNPSKTVSLIISRKINKPCHPPLIMDGTNLNAVEHHKHLGLYFSNDGGWHKHVQYISEKAWKRVSILRTLKYMLDRNSLEKLYFSFIRPILEYGDVVWDNCTLKDKKSLESIQLECARIVTGASKCVSIEKLYLDLGWETLQKRRTDHKLHYFYKMINNLVPDYLADLVPQYVRERSNNSYPLRNASDISHINARTALYKNSFLPLTSTLWNSLPITTRTAPTLNCFKSLISKPLVKSPLYYNCGSRPNQIYHTRIRLDSSFLNGRRYEANLVESPLCECGSRETAAHFFLHCPRFTLQRQLCIDTNLIEGLL